MNKKPCNLPSLPGVYLFKNNHEILYIGKAKNIKRRVSSYFKATHDWKINALIAEHTHIDHIVTHAEHDALLLEAQLINTHKPKFNVLLKNGNPFIYVVFTAHDMPIIDLARAKTTRGTYFGPFLQKRQARSVYEYLVSTFRLRLCAKKIENGCLNYHLGKCAGNCLATFDKADYLFRLELAKELLQGNFKKTLKALQEKIKEYSAQLDYEKAKHMRAYEQNLETIFETLKHKYSEKKYEADVFMATSPFKELDYNAEKTAEDLQKRFNLPYAPQTIDCFDISHFQSKEIVGSCIRFTRGKPDKNNFRRFIIRSITEQNDYAALQEIVARRYRNRGELPDLIVIDGGKGQLNAVAHLVPDTSIMSLAKREETVFGNHLPSEGIKLDIHSSIGKLLLSLRDYTHHFAISFHRKKRDALFFQE